MCFKLRLLRRSCVVCVMILLCICLLLALVVIFGMQLEECGPLSVNVLKLSSITLDLKQATCVPTLTEIIIP